MADAPQLTMGQRTALSVPPLLLRLVLALVFVWAGANKMFVKFDVTPEMRPALVAAGSLPAEAPAPPEAARPVPDAAPQPEPAPEPAPEPTPEPTPPANPEPGSGEPTEDPGSVTLVSWLQAAATPAAERLPNYHYISMGLHEGANPAPVVRAQGQEPVTPIALVPKALGSPPWAVRLALAAALTELIAGGLLLIGLATRLSAFSLAVVMGVAMWLTVIGPAIQSGNAWLGFLPAGGFAQPEAYQTWFMQLAMLAMALALVFSGPGMLSLDRWIFGRAGHDEQD